MTPEAIIEVGNEAIRVTILLAAPVLIFGFVAGLIISIIQATTQVHEMTLTFIPKMIAVVLALVLFSPWMLKIISDFTTRLFTSIPTYIH
ncbi:MAG: flagellar biosynthesis protein FliQ [Thermodesulfobacteriota bacterium]|nr:flagellar biosynthesis protein FliQ [Thermodesulfobacteriota bacterium]